jgi:hypothetical protein
MSKLIKCKSCETEIASDSKACPKCGSPNKKRGCLSIVFGSLILVIGVAALISAASTKDGNESAEFETKEGGASVSSKKGNDTPPKGEEKTVKSANEREKLKVKGLYIGMKSDQFMKAIVPIIKEICLRENSEFKVEDVFDSEGHFWEDVIVSRKVGLYKNVELIAITPRTKKQSDGTFHYETVINFIPSKEGYVAYFELLPVCFNMESFDTKVFVPEFIKSYKLALIAPKAILKSGGVEPFKPWSCALPFGVEVTISSSVELREITSEAEEAAANAKKINDAKKALN